MNNIKVRNMVSTRGNEVPNQFTIYADGVNYFQSYQSMIAKYDGTVLTLGHDWDYSDTTLKYLYIWLNNNCRSTWRGLEVKTSIKKAIQTAIDNGIICYNGGMR